MSIDAVWLPEQDDTVGAARVDAHHGRTLVAGVIHDPLRRCATLGGTRHEASPQAMGGEVGRV